MVTQLATPQDWRQIAPLESAPSTEPDIQAAAVESSGAKPVARSHAWFGLGVAACIGLLLILLWGGVTLHLSFDKAQTTSHAALNASNLSQVVDEHLTRRIYEIDQTLLAAKREYEKSSAGFDAKSFAVEGLTPGKGAALVRVIAATAEVMPDRADPGDRNAYTAHRGSPAAGLLIGDPVRASAGGGKDWGIPFSRRLDHADGSFAGIVVATVDPAFFSTTFDKINIGQQGFIAIIGAKDFVVLASATEAGVSVPRLDLRNSPLPAAAAQAPAGAYADAGLGDGAPRIIGYRTLRDYPLLIAIGASKDEILAPYNARRTWLILASAAISLVLLGGAALLLRLDARRRRGEAELLLRAEELLASRQEAERAHVAAQTADRAKSEFLANMSHELRTPLNAILGFSEMTSMAALGPISDRYRSYAQNIHTAGSHLLKILNDILDLSKIEAGRFELYEEDVSIDELFDTCRKIVAERAVAAGLVLEFRSGGLELRGDPLRLKQILFNLLSNAVKFTPAGGRVAAIASLAENDSITITVRDTGIGIRPDDVERALQPFGQVNNATTRSQQGTGLGLPLVRRLVELHGGEMMLNSVPDEGTTITLIFPAARTLSPSQSAAAAS